MPLSPFTKKELTRSSIILLKTCKEPIRRMLDPSEDDDGKVADVHRDVALEGDHPDTLLHHVRARDEERTPSGSPSFQLDEKGNQLDDRRLAVVWH